MALTPGYSLVGLARSGVVGGREAPDHYHDRSVRHDTESIPRIRKTHKGSWDSVTPLQMEEAVWLLSCQVNPDTSTHVTFDL